MEDALSALSRRTAALVAERAVHVVRVEGRRRGPASGVVWSADGLVVAAHHAIERDDELEVGLPSGDATTAEVVGRDPSTDLALLRVKATGLSPAPWGDADALAAGELVVSIARPGRSPRASLAVLARAAGEYRATSGGRIDRFLETTIEPHPGMSGALVTAASGSPVGLATSGLARGAAMIVPASTLRRVVRSLAAHGGVRRGYLGVATFPVRLPPALAAAEKRSGALLVSYVEADGPAARAGLLQGDALLALGGAPIEEPRDLLPLLEEERIGEAVAVRLVRAGEVREIAITVGARGARP